MCRLHGTLIQSGNFGTPVISCYKLVPHVRYSIQDPNGQESQETRPDRFLNVTFIRSWRDGEAAVVHEEAL